MRSKLQQNLMQEVIGDNKERDYKILEFIALNPDEIYENVVESLSLEIGKTRVCQIVNDNIDLLYKIFAQKNPLALKEGRVFELARVYTKRRKHGIDIQKDQIEILEQIRKEYTQEKGLQVNIQNNVAIGSFTGEDKQFADEQLARYKARFQRS